MLKLETLSLYSFLVSGIQQLFSFLLQLVSDASDAQFTGQLDVVDVFLSTGDFYPLTWYFYWAFNILYFYSVVLLRFHFYWLQMMMLFNWKLYVVDLAHKWYENWFIAWNDNLVILKWLLLNNFFSFFFFSITSISMSRRKK